VVSQAFNRARKRAGVEDIHFHDLRHMAITRMAEKLPNLIELSAVSGHKSLAMLKRYYHPNPELLATKLG
jgi:integrase